MTDDELIERMAEAAWNVHATIPFSTFFRDHPDKKPFYIDNMRAALAVVDHWAPIRNQWSNRDA